MRKIVTVLAAVSLTAGPTGLLASQKVQYDARFAAKYPNFIHTPKIGVIGFGGNEGGSFEVALTTALQTAQFDGNTLFTVSTPATMISRVGTEPSRTEVAAAIRVGQKLGAQVVFIGRAVSNMVASRYTKQVSVCVEHGSGFLSPCRRSENQTQQCERVTVQYTAAPQGILVANGTIVYSEMKSYSKDVDDCSGAAANQAEQILSVFRVSAATAVRNDIAPYTEKRTIELKEHVDGLSRADKKQLDIATDFAGRGRMDRACAMIEGMMQGDNLNNPYMLYNMGVCQEVLLPEDPKAAFDYYSKADEKQLKADRLISAAYERSKQMVAESQRATRQTRGLTPGHK